MKLISLSFDVDAQYRDRPDFTRKCLMAVVATASPVRVKVLPQEGRVKVTGPSYWLADFGTNIAQRCCDGEDDPFNLLLQRHPEIPFTALLATRLYDNLTAWITCYRAGIICVCPRPNPVRE